MNTTLDVYKSIKSPIRISVATEEEKQYIYRLRHVVYANELKQYDANPEGILMDSPGIRSSYIAAFKEDELVGFIGITPPTSPRYSIDKYLPRNEIPIEIGRDLYEFRALTVKKLYRNSPAPIAAALLYAAFRWVESRNGTRILAFGRSEVLDLYLKFGFKEMGKSFRYGAVNFELITAQTNEVAARIDRFSSILNRIEKRFDWNMEINFYKSTVCYHGGAFFRAIGDRFDNLDRKEDIISADVLDAWFPPAPEALDALAKHLSWAVSTSPPTHAEGLTQTIAEARGINPECVITGAGSSTLIYQAFLQWINSSSRVLVLDPSYGEYLHVLENVIRCNVERLTLNRQNSFTIDIDVLAEKLKEPFDLFVWVNPNSPTGVHLPREQVEALLKESSSCKRIWIDETYIEYAGHDQSLELFATQSENVIVCKSMSKVYALSGLRVAYLCAATHQLEVLKMLNPPWPVSLPGQIMATYALKALHYYDECYRQTHDLRAQLTEGLRKLGITEIIPSVTNFILFYLPPDYVEAVSFIKKCREQGLYIRDASSMGQSMEQGAIRIAVKDSTCNQRSLEILARVIDISNLNS